MIITIHSTCRGKTSLAREGLFGANQVLHEAVTAQPPKQLVRIVIPHADETMPALLRVIANLAILA